MEKVWQNYEKLWKCGKMRENWGNWAQHMDIGEKAICGVGKMENEKNLVKKALKK